MIGPDGVSMGDQTITLIVVSGGDVASTNQAEAMRSFGGWMSGPEVESMPTYSNKFARMWVFPEGVLREDHVDLRWYEATGERVSEVIFPSRHVAESGRACLTLHPIGVMQLDPASVPPFGGKAGDAPPPSPRLGPWWRSLLLRSSQEDLGEAFDISLEVTHHGPWLEAPCLFIEVGSTSATWGHIGAARLLARLMHEGLGLDGSGGLGRWNEHTNAGEPVLITLGGGHYAPRGNLTASEPGIWLGHMLATYALPFDPAPEEGLPVTGLWRQSIDAAYAATQKAFPGGNIVFSMDRKAFKGWQRQAIREHLGQLGAPLLKRQGVLDLVG
jgi:D-aminoacyl-tRNA deacylase